MVSITSADPLHAYLYSVFGSCVLEEFNKEAEPEKNLLSLARSFLLDSNANKNIAWNIREHLRRIGVDWIW